MINNLDSDFDSIEENNFKCDHHGYGSNKNNADSKCTCKECNN